MNTITPNPEDSVVAVEEVVVTPSEIATEVIGTDDVETIDYKQKFIDSAKGAHELLKEKRELEAELALARSGNSQTPLQQNSPTNSLYPGFEELDPESQANLMAYTNAVTERAKAEILQDPSIAFARNNYNESVWESTFSDLVVKYPQLASAKSEFKAKYYNPKNVPPNLADILDTVAKAYLFDEAREIGAKEGHEVASRVVLEEPTGGDKTPSVHRSLEDWQRLAQENPAKFATMKKEYDADIASGKLKE